VSAVAAPLAAVTRELEGVLASVETIRAEAVEALTAVERPGRDDLVALRAPVAALLDGHRGFAAGRRSPRRAAAHPSSDVSRVGSVGSRG
jgi:hypothetical protein